MRGQVKRLRSTVLTPMSRQNDVFNVYIRQLLAWVSSVKLEARTCIYSRIFQHSCYGLLETATATFFKRLILQAGVEKTFDFTSENNAFYPIQSYCDVQRIFLTTRSRLTPVAALPLQKKAPPGLQRQSHTESPILGYFFLSPLTSRPHRSHS